MTGQRTEIVTGQRTEPVAPLGSATDKGFVVYSPKGEVREKTPSGAPRYGQPPAMGWFLLAVMAVAVVLVLAWLFLVP